MNELNRNDYVEYRLEKAEETYDVAVLLVENSKWNSAVNRLYYACFYAITALLVQSEFEAKTHSGVKTQFFLHYIKTGKMSLEFGKLYSDLFDWRQKGDYGDFFDFTAEDVEPLLKPTRELINSINKEIEK